MSPNSGTVFGTLPDRDQHIDRYGTSYAKHGGSESLASSSCNLIRADTYSQSATDESSGTRSVVEHGTVKVTENVRSRVKRLVERRVSDNLNVVTLTYAEHLKARSLIGEDRNGFGGLLTDGARRSQKAKHKGQQKEKMLHSLE